MKWSLLCLAVVIAFLAVSRPAAAGSIITQWNFENQPVTGAPPYNNSPTPSTGSGTAIVLNMTNSYGTPNPSVAASDILADPGSSDPLSLQAWRIRGQGVSSSAPANGWSTLAPQYSQGAEFDVSTGGFSNIHVSFDWMPTNRGVEDIELQYNPNVANAAGWLNAGAFHNTVPGGVWNNGNSVDLSADPSIASDPNFGIRIVSAYHPGTSTYFDTNGTVLNDNSGNIRLDNVTISGDPAVATPEPATLGLLATGVLPLLGYAWRLRRNKVHTADV